MRLLDSRFLRGPNIHHMGQCLVSVLDLEGHRPVGLAELPQGAAALRTLMPRGAAAMHLGAAEVARLLARLVSAAQAWAGSPASFCDAVSLAPTAPARYRLVCGYQHEAVAEAALRLSVDCLTALLAERAFDLDLRLGELRAVVDACAHLPAAAALLQAARARGIPVTRAEAGGQGFALGWGARQRHCIAGPPEREGIVPSLDSLFAGNGDGRIPVVAITGTNGKTTTTQLIAHVMRASGTRTGTTTTQGIFIDGLCVETGDCSGYWSARRVLSDPSVEAAALETARGGILKRGLAFDRCDVGVVLNVSSDHLGLDGIETLQDLAHVKGLVARCARAAAVLNAEDAWCVAMRNTLAPGCAPVFFAMDPRHPVLLDHLGSGGAGACLDDDGWLVWCRAGHRTRVVQAAQLPFTLQGHARFNIANALAALAALHCLGHGTTAIAQSLLNFVSDAKTNPMRTNLFDVDGVRLIVDYAHNVAAYRAICEMARALLAGPARLLGVVTAPGDRRPEDLYETGRACGRGFDELVVYEHDPRGRGAGATSQEILRGARSAAPDKRLHREPCIRHALSFGLGAAHPGDVLVFTCAGSFDDLIEGVRLRHPTAADDLVRQLSCGRPTHLARSPDEVAQA